MFQKAHVDLWPKITNKEAREETRYQVLHCIHSHHPDGMMILVLTDSMSRKYRSRSNLIILGVSRIIMSHQVFCTFLKEFLLPCQQILSILVGFVLGKRWNALTRNTKKNVRTVTSPSLLIMIRPWKKSLLLMRRLWIIFFKCYWIGMLILCLLVRKVKQELRKLAKLMLPPRSKIGLLPPTSQSKFP